MSSIEEKLNYIATLNELRLEGIGCDVIIQVGERSFLAHRVVLMARVEYFRSLLTIDMRDRQQLFITLDSTVIEPGIFSDILDYIYLFKVDFTPQNFQPICRAADYFCFEELFSKARNYMKHSLNQDSVNSLMNIATGNASKAAEEECEKLLILNPTSEITRKLLIPTLTIESLKLLISKMITLSREEEMFNYCVEWIFFDSESRKDRMTELLSTIRLEGLSLSFIKETVLKNRLIIDDKESLQLVADALLIRNSTERMFAIGGRDKKILSSISQYCSMTDKWTILTSMPSGNCYFGSVVIGSKIYICGGFNDRKDTAELRVLDTETMEWKTLKSMKHSRESFGMAAMNGYIYVAGGGNERVKLAVVERYSIADDEWKEMTPMGQERSGLELVEIAGCLYAMGGSKNERHFSLVERYCPAKNQWKSVASMNNALAWFGSTVLDGKIYVAGGKAFEVYDPMIDRWQQLPPPTECGFGRQLVTFNGRVYSVGGSFGSFRDFNGIKTVEYFDNDKGRWIQGKDMNVPRCYHRVVVEKED